MKKTNNKLAITIGDVGGIGPEIIVKALNSPELSASIDNIVLIGNKNFLYRTAIEFGYDFPQNIEFYDIPLDVSKVLIGEPTVEAGKHSFLAVKTACELAKQGYINAIATAPVSKEAINKAGYYYTGQTEILEEFLGTKPSFEANAIIPVKSARLKRVSKFLKTKIKKIIPGIIKKYKQVSQPEMLFVADDLKVLLLTRHIKLDAITSVLTIEGIIKSVLALNNSLIKDFKVQNPKIAICGLNPHAGENSLFGNEEDYIIKPALNKLRKEYNIFIEGPFPADALWAKTAKYYLNKEKLPYDAYVACYHDQGLIPVKMLAMDKAVNTTINLPVIRTSPSHGTAYDIAGQNKANCQSMIEAINLANKTFSLNEINV